MVLTLLRLIIPEFFLLTMHLVNSLGQNIALLALQKK